MKTNGMLRRILSLLMAVAICVSVVPWTVFATGESAVYTKVTDQSQFTTGQYVLMVDTGVAPSVLSGKWVLAANPTVDGDVVTDPAGAVWTLTVSGSSVRLTDSNGVSIAPSGGNNNGIKSGSYDWNWTFANGKFTFAGAGSDTVVLASNKGSSGQFRAYKSATVAGNPNGYPSEFTLYKLTEIGGEVDPSEPEETTQPSEPEETTQPSEPEETTQPSEPEETTQPSEPAVTVVDIATALAASEGEFTVKGVVTLLDGQNVYVQDATGGICVRLATYSDQIALGDVIIGTGTRAEYNGLPQLGDATFEKSEGLTLAARETTIGALTTADICTYVTIKGLEVTEINGDNTTLSDGTNTIKLYKGKLGDTTLKVGDKLDFTGAVGVYKTTLQLRNTLPSELVVTAAPTEPTDPSEPTEPSEPEVPTGIVWTKVDLADITDTDIIAITMTKGGTTWVLPIVAAGSKGQPLATYTGTIEGDALITDVAETYGWNIVATDGGYHITAGGKYLYVNADNNGVRIGKNAAVWNVKDGYLAASDSKGDTRYIGVYNNQDWRCYKNTTGNTAGQTLGFWKLGAAEPEDPWADVDAKYSVYQQITQLSDGDVVVIYNPGNTKALSSQDASYYKAGVSATVTDDYIASDADYIQWTVSVVNGVYTFKQGNLTLGIEPSGTFFNLKTASGDTGFTIQETAEGSGLYYIYSSTLTGQYGNVYLEWYASKNAFSAYCTGADRLTEKDFGFKFYKLVRQGVKDEEPDQPEQPDQPEIPTGVADGDYVIWAPAYNMAISTVYNGYYNTGVAVTMENGKLTGYTAAEVWTVKNNEDGTITISCEGGKLSMDTGFSSMPLNKVNDTWTLSDAGNGLWYVKNVGRDNYIEWYADKSNWSGYSTIGSGKEGMFALQFTPAEDAQEPEKPTGIADGDYVIWAPAFNKALSSIYGGFYNNGVDLSVAGETISGYTIAEIWTVKNNDDGTISISYGGKNLGMADSYSSLTLGEKRDKWTLEDAGDGLFYIKNVGRECYIEWYSDKGYWSGYGSIGAGKEGLFALRFTPAERGYNYDSSIVENIAQWGGMTNSGNTAFIYGDKYVVGDEKDIQDIFTAVVSGNPVTPWTKGGNNDAPLYYMGGTGLGSGTDDYLQFAVNAAGWANMELSFRLRASNSGPGSFQLQYSTDGGKTFQNFTSGSYAYAYTGYGSGGVSYPVTGEGTITDGIAKTSFAPAKYVSFVFDVPSGAENCGNLIIRLVPGTDKANGSTGAVSASGTIRVDSVFLSGSPIVDPSVTGYVTIDPSCDEDQSAGTELTMTSSTEGAVISYRVNGGEWQTYDPEKKPTLDTLPCDIEVKASKEGLADSVVMLYHYAAGTVENVRVSPNGGGIFIEGESTQVTLSTATEGATIYYATSTDGVTFTEYAVYTDPIVLQKGFEKLVVKAYAEKEGFKPSTEVTRTFTERSSSTWGLYFGQLHSHTNISDGSGSVEEAFAYASNVPGLDFLAVTDHSNSFDNEGNGVLAGGVKSNEWEQGHEAAAAVTDGDFVGLYGFEMTWSNGLGHMNTFNTPGWQSRTQSQFTNASTALQNYYAALATVPESISQFNHPGTTFGDFSDFAYYNELNDSLITLIEVGNGEGTIGSSGYFPSYEYYTRALDKGWHVAPTNNQDNHKGRWGDSNTGRTVVLADSLTEEGIYDALRNYRVYATEDNDLHIYYSLNGNIMGAQLSRSDVDDKVTLTVNISDYTDANIGKVEVIVNGGLSIAEQNVTGSSQTVTFTVSSDYNYYYIKITQPDGDIAVTAPVWIGKVEAVGISSLETESELTIAGDEQKFTMDMFNNERYPMAVESIVFTNKATGEVIYTETGISSVPREGTASCGFSYTFAKDGIYTITATVTGTLNGVRKTYTKDLELNVMPKNITSQIIVDGTHSNDYVSGYYGGNMNNMVTIAAAQGINVHIETNKITPEMLENCSLLIISAPAKKLDRNNPSAYSIKPFEDDFIDMVAQYVKNGGSVVICGLADYQDKGALGGADGHAAAQLNKLLVAMGSTMRINDDQAMDDVNFSNQNYRLYPKNFNMESKWCAGIVTGENGQEYSQYSGCTVDPGQGTWLVKGFDTTYSADSDNDGKGGVAKGEAVFMAAEDTGFGGTVFVAGGVFLSDFEVKAELDNIWSLPYANRTIYENIIGVTRAQPEVTTIAEVRQSAKEGLGRIFVIEGYVTAGTANANTKFFDAIYLQDATGGITVFPYSAAGLEIGTKMRITGYTDAYQGDIEIQILSYEILEEPKHIFEPAKMDNKDAMNYDENGGELIQVEGVVTEVILGSDGKSVSQFVLKDEKGDLAKIFIDGYILSGTTGVNELADIVKVGNTVLAAGLLYMHPEGDSTESVAVLRVRDCDEVVLIKEGKPAPGTDDNAPTGDVSGIVPMVFLMTASVMALAVLTFKRKDYAEK